MTKRYLIFLFLIAMIQSIMAQETWPADKSLLQNKLDSLANRQPELLHICRFFYRYTNELKNLSPTERQVKLKIDQARIEYGKPENLALLSTNASILMRSSGNRHTVTITDDTLVAFSLSFPRSYELLVGMNKIELENRFSSEVQQCKSAPSGSDTLATMAIDLKRGYRIKKGNNYLIKALSSDLYYQLSDTGYRQIFDPEYPAESLSNLLLSPHCTGSYILELTIRKYGFKTECFSIPLKQWINYCRQSGCDSYIGIESIDKDKITATLFVVNELLQYVHVLNITVSSRQIKESSGTLQANIHIYIPTNNISELFGKYKESNNTKIPISSK